MPETFVHVLSLTPASLSSDILLHEKTTAPDLVTFTHLSMADEHLASVGERDVPM